MRWTFVFTCFLTFILFLSTSCVLTLVDYRDPSARYPSEQFHRVVPLKQGGTLSLINVDGHIEIQGWDRDEVEINAENASPRWQERKIRVFAIGRFRPRVDVDKFEDFVKIKTRLPSDEQDRPSIDYYLSVPRSIFLKEVVGRRGSVLIADLFGEAYVELEEGDVRVENFSGALIVSVIRGSVVLELYDLRSEDEIRITSAIGNITVYLQPEVEAQIDAKTPNGSISCEFDLNITLPAKEVNEQIKGGEGAYLSLSASDGDIHIRKIK